MDALFILYVKSQEKSTAFYKALLQKDPALYAEGMTEFDLNPHAKLGLLHNAGVENLFPKEIFQTDDKKLIPRCELYLEVDNVNTYYKNAIELGAKPLNAPENRDWGHYVGYVMDFDAHIIAFYQLNKTC